MYITKQNEQEISCEFWMHVTSQLVLYFYEMIYF